jgi:NADH-quinone oxidoreductase subunit C
MDMNKLRIQFGNGIRHIAAFREECTVTVDKEIIVPVCRFLKDTEGFAFDYLSDCCGVDRFPDTPRFQVVYHLYSTVHNHRLRIKTPVGDGAPVIDSVVPVWPAADWLERECYDMFGITFRNHPDMRRILMTGDFEGHPLKKDFPLEGR